MKKQNSNLLFYGLLAVAFYGLPLAIQDTGSGILILLVVIPAVCFAVSIAYGLKNGFRPWYGLIAAVLFLPSVFLFYNESAWVYAVGYGLVALAGNLLALPFRKR